MKLIKYLKPFALLVFTAVLLLFVQAMCDLALPDYTSDIVNKGIQQGGITTAVPKALRKSTMDLAEMFMSSSDKEEVEKNYTLIDTNNKNSDYDKYVKDYSDLKKESIYVLKNIDKAETDKLNPIMGKAMICASQAQKMMGAAKKKNEDAMKKMSPAEKAAAMQNIAAQQKAAADQQAKMISDAKEKINKVDKSLITQMAAPAIKAEYKTLGVDTDKIQNNYVLTTGLYMLLISLLGGVCTVGVGFLAAKTAAGMARNLRKKIFEKVESFSNAEFDQFSTASLITRSTNDITQIQMLMVIMIRMVFYAPILGVGGVIRALNKSKSMSWIIGVAVIVLLMLVVVVFIVAVPKFRIIQKLIDKLNLVTRENLSGMMVIRAFNTQKFEENRFDKANKDVTGVNLFVSRVMVCMMPFMMLVMNGISLLIVWIVAHQVADSTMQVGDMMAFMQYAMLIIIAFLMMSVMFIMLPRAAVSAQRIDEVLKINITINDPKDAKHFDDSTKGTVEFKNVSFKYPKAEENALNNISFKAETGKTTAFIGSTGSGKTTLINLIMRFYDVSEGEVLVDGINVKDVTQHELHNKVGYVPQKAYLFSGTIESNLKYADKNTDEDTINKYAEVSQSMEFIKEKEEGMKSEISQGGSNVSGGQKQRLSIARALVKKPEIYVFDDSFSALDFKTDAALRLALRNETKDGTFLIVGQRISTIKDADQIIVLDDGYVVGIGTHAELMENCETYQEIALSQLSKEELA